MGLDERLNHEEAHPREREAVQKSPLKDLAFWTYLTGMSIVTYVGIKYGVMPILEYVLKE